MKHPLPSFASILGLAVLAAACATATGDDQSATPVVDAGPKADAGKADAKGNPGTDGGGGAMCPSQCTSDQDCQISCPAAGQGTNCCDTQTGVCYVDTSSVCPSPPDASFGGG